MPKEVIQTMLCEISQNNKKNARSEDKRLDCRFLESAVGISREIDLAKVYIKRFLRI
jgi:hypothetical protein